MDGFKTILGLLVAAFVVPVFAKRGLALSPEDQAAFVAAGMAAIGVGFRVVTVGPVFGSLRDWFTSRATAKAAAASAVSADQVSQLADAVLAELKRRATANTKVGAK